MLNFNFLLIIARKRREGNVLLLSVCRSVHGEESLVLSHEDLPLVPGPPPTCRPTHMGIPQAQSSRPTLVQTCSLLDPDRDCSHSTT